MNIYDVVIVGGGQAGLSVGYYLKKTDLSFLILDKSSEVGEIWRRRYDSLRLFTPALYSSLPGYSFQNVRQSHPTKDEVADYLQFYAIQHALPIKLNTDVKALEQECGGYKLVTSTEVYRAKQVVIATGPFQKPRIPTFAQHLSNQVLQLHSSEYRNPKQLKDGSVLVIGGGNSGAQIAVELAGKRDVYFSVSDKMKIFPLTLGSKSIFWYIDKLGIYDVGKDSLVGKLLSRQKDPILGTVLKPLLKSGEIKQKPRTVSVIDDVFCFYDGSQVKVDNVIWSTGFQPDYSWINVENLFDHAGFPVHRKGITTVEGLYFIGLAWLRSRNSALLGGVGKDSEYLVSEILRKSFRFSKDSRDQNNFDERNMERKGIVTK